MWRFTVFCLLAICAPLIASAQPFVTVESEAVQVSIEGPPWIEGAERSVQQGVSGSGKGVVISEFIPKGERFDAWSQLFAIMIEEDVTLNLATYKAQQIGRFAGACNMVPEQVHAYFSNANYEIFLVPCPNYLGAPEHGEIAVMIMVHAEPHFVKVYHHYRGNAFDVSDQTQWPVAIPDLEGFLKRLEGLQVGVLR